MAIFDWEWAEIRPLDKGRKVVVVSKKKQKKVKKNIFCFTFLNWKKQLWYWEKMWLFSIGNGAVIPPLD